tara:strand:- start:168 stop:539 length:372 start_codon:yes stop_codon:yes gene_type:complete
MNVEDFVSESISQIVRGVKKAAVEGVSHGAMVTPEGAHGEMSPLQLIQFDIAVTVQSAIEATASGKGKAGILKVLGAEVSGGGSGSLEQTSVSRLRFAVPVDLPYTEMKRSEPNEFGEKSWRR